jgi:hypothetical protein
VGAEIHLGLHSFVFGDVVKIVKNRNYHRDGKSKLN